MSDPASSGDRDNERPETRRFYRIIAGQMPTRADFLSDRDADKPPPRNPDRVRYWRGRSLFATAEAARDTIAARQARATARGETSPRAYLAEVTIFPTDPIVSEQSGRNAEHYTLWGDADALLMRVTDVLPGHPDDGGTDDGDVLPTVERRDP